MVSHKGDLLCEGVFRDAAKSLDGNNLILRVVLWVKGKELVLLGSVLLSRGGQDK